MSIVSLDSRIAVVGGGAAGVTAAYHLSRVGYTQVTLFEQKTHLGGKCLTVSPEENVHVDLGAVEVTEFYTEILSLADSLDVELRKQPIRAVGNVAKGEISYRLIDVVEGHETMKAALEIARWAYQVWIRLRDDLQDPVNAKHAQELNVPFREWLSNNNMDGLLPLYSLGATDKSINALGARKAIDVLTSKHNVAFERHVFRQIEGDAPLGFAMAMVRYIYHVGVKFSSFVDQPGLNNAPVELFDTFEQWLHKRGMSSLKNVIEVVLSPYGYGRLSSTPALYGVKFLNIVHFIMLFLLELGDGRWPKRFRLGYQELVNRLATQIPNVQLGTRVEEIRRGDAVYILTSHGEVLEFDYLVIATGLDARLLSILDASTLETHLLRQVKRIDYWVLVARMSGFPDAVVHTYPLTDHGRPWISFNTAPRNDLLSFYAIGGDGITEDSIKKNIQHDMERLGIRDEVEFVQTKYWRYFYHVAPAALKDGFYERMEGLQGQNRTFYSSSLLSFELVESVARYSRSIVERYFHSSDAIA